MNKKIENTRPNNPGPSGRKQLARGALVNLGGKAIGRGLFILSQIILARILGPDLFGLYGIGWIFFRLSGIVSTLGLESGVIHFSSQIWENDKNKFTEIVLSAFITVFFVGGIISFLVYLGADSIAQAFNKTALEEVLKGFSLGIPALAGITVLSSATRVSKDMKRSNLIEEIFLPGTTLLAIFLVFILKGNLYDYVLGSALATWLSLFLSLFVSNNKSIPIRTSWEKIRPFIKKLVVYSLPVALPALLGTIISLADRIFTGYFLPEVDTGIYQSVSLISALFIAVLSAFKTISAPLLADNFHKQDQDQQQNIMRDSTRWVLILCAPVLMFIFIFPGELIALVFGSQYLPGIQTLVVLGLAQLINISKGPVDQLLIMTGNQGSWLKVTLVAVVVNLLTNLIMVPTLGINGAALSQLITYAVLAGGGIYYAKKKNELVPYDRNWLIVFTSSSFLALILLGANSILEMPDLPKLLISGLFTGFVYSVLIYLIGLTDQERNWLKTQIIK